MGATLSAPQQMQTHHTGNAAKRFALLACGKRPKRRLAKRNAHYVIRNGVWQMPPLTPTPGAMMGKRHGAWLITKPPCRAWQARALPSDRTGFSARRTNGLSAYRSIGLVYQLICQMDLSNGSVSRPACARRPGFRNRPARSKTVGSHAPKRGWPAARSLAHGRFATRWRRHCPQATHWS